ncbi:U-box domain-containing protein 14-like [Pyrus communis]|uniref:U-box domain-containing protein 14-like n=1 Tax=Pyrus communis TaxID=23211 RepID=UPI0035C200EC
MGQRLLARSRQVESLMAEVENLKQEIKQLKLENRMLHVVANNYSTGMKRKLDELQESEGVHVDVTDNDGEIHTNREETLYGIFHRLIVEILFPGSTSAGAAAPLFQRIKTSLAKNGPLLHEASRNSGRNVLLWTRRGSPLRALLVISVGTITLLALTGLLVFTLFFAAATFNAVAISLLLSLAAGKPQGPYGDGKSSDRSGEFPTTSSQSRQLLIAYAFDNSDDMIQQLVAVLEAGSTEEQKQAAMEIRLLAKNKSENRLKIARNGAIKPLLSLLSSSDLQLQEYGVTAILNLLLCDENKELIASSGAIKPLVRSLETGTATAKENAACALFRLSQIEENKAAIGRSGAIPLLVNLLECGGFGGKKDASMALYSLCSVKENKIKVVESGIMKPLVELMADFGSNMVDKSAYVLSVLVSVPEARAALVEEGGIPVLVEILEAMDGEHK